MKPIIFRTDMVQAILKGKKTQTRRVVKDINYNALAFVGINDKGDPVWCVEDANTFPAKYKIGDILWVKESWAIQSDGTTGHYFYKADYNEKMPNVEWKNAMFMPKVAARLFLEITDMRIEKLKEITTKDMFAEGIQRYGNPLGNFIVLWDSTHARTGYGWDTNPYVYVIKFKRIERDKINGR